MEEIKPSGDGSAFHFWGYHGKLILPDGLSKIELHYRTEPPHGDFLYSLEIGGKVVAADSRIRLFWGRNLVLSPCGLYFGVTEFSLKDGAFCVFNLRELTEWQQKGYLNLNSLVFPTLTVRPWITGEGNVTYGEKRDVNLEDVGPWSPLSFIRSSDVGDICWPPWRN